jgi:hypothetical protein
VSVGRQVGAVRSLAPPVQRNPSADHAAFDVAHAMKFIERFVGDELKL